MSFIGKFFVFIFGFFATSMLFIYLFRLVNTDNTFIGLSDIYYYFDANKFDIYSSFTEMIEHIKKIFTDFIDTLVDTSIFTSIEIDGFLSFFTAIGKFFTYLGTCFVALFQVLFFPIYCIIDILKFIYSIFDFIFGFIGFLAA